MSQAKGAKAARARIARIQDRVRAIDLVCSGTLVRRWKVCGQPSCRCHQDSAARHGPYFEWGYMEGGRQVHRMVTPEQAKLLRTAIRNYRTIRGLLRAWEEESARLIQVQKRLKRRAGA